jgi:Zn-dependent protease
VAVLLCDRILDSIEAYFALSPQMLAMSVDLGQPENGRLSLRAAREIVSDPTLLSVDADAIWSQLVRRATAATEPWQLAVIWVMTPGLRRVCRRCRWYGTLVREGARLPDGRLYGRDVWHGRCWFGGSPAGGGVAAQSSVPVSPALRRPSVVFVGLLVLCVVGGWMTWTGSGGGRLGVFILVVAGWVVSLCLHEYAHARTAYHAGDAGVAAKGYLTLNPLRYSDVGLSILLPVLFVLLGGIGLPGGAVWIDRGRIPGRIRHSLVSAAGPLVNVALAAAILVTVSQADSYSEHLEFWAALAFLGFLQVTASLLNLLPVPGLDGFGIWEPWLPRAWVRSAGQVSGFGLLALFALLFIPSVNRAFFGLVDHITSALGVPPELVALGDTLFRFWAN